MPLGAFAAHHHQNHVVYVWRSPHRSPTLPRMAWPLGLAMVLWLAFSYTVGAWFASQYVNGGWLALVILVVLVGGYALIWAGFRLVAPDWMRRVDEIDARERQGIEAAATEEAYRELKASRKRRK